MRASLLLVVLAAIACQRVPATVDASAPPATRVADAAGAPDSLRVDAGARVPDARPADARPQDAGEPDAEAEPKRETFFEKSVTGSLVVLGTNKPLEGATVHLACTRVPPADSSRTTCDSELSVEKDGKVVAGRDEGVAGIDFEAAGGNNGSVDLELLVLEADTGASFIAVRSHRQEGDEWMKGEDDLQLFAVSGEDLDQVLNVSVYSLDEPGPDGGRRREETETIVEAGKRKTSGMRNLIATERDSRSGRTRSVVTYIWDGAGYVDKKTLAPAPVPDAGPPPKPKP